MAGKHRGSSRRGQAVGLTRYTLTPSERSELVAIARTEKRSIANTVSVLISEALAARRAAERR